MDASAPRPQLPQQQALLQQQLQQQAPQLPTVAELREMFRASAADQGLDMPTRKLAARLALLVLAVDRRLRLLEKTKAEGKDVQNLNVGIGELFKILAPFIEAPAEPQDPGQEGQEPQELQEGVPQVAEDAPAAAPPPEAIPEAPLQVSPPPALSPPVPPQVLRGPPRVKQPRGPQNGGRS